MEHEQQSVDTECKGNMDDDDGRNEGDAPACDVHVPSEPVRSVGHSPLRSCLSQGRRPGRRWFRVLSPRHRENVADFDFHAANIDNQMSAVCDRLLENPRGTSANQKCVTHRSVGVTFGKAQLCVPLSV